MLDSSRSEQQPRPHPDRLQIIHVYRVVLFILSTLVELFCTGGMHFCPKTHMHLLYNRNVEGRNIITAGVLLPAVLWALSLCSRPPPAPKRLEQRLFETLTQPPDCVGSCHEGLKRQSASPLL